MYETLILIDPESNIEGLEIRRRVATLFEREDGGKPTVTWEEPVLSIDWSDYQIRLALDDGPHVYEESQEIAQEFAQDHGLADRIRSCRERIDISGENDPEMDHFNDYCLILETIESLGEVYTFDPMQGEFLNI